MGGKSDEVKGRIKKAAGGQTGNDKLRRGGQSDQAVGKGKQTVEKVVTDVQSAGEAAPDKIK